MTWIDWALLISLSILGLTSLVFLIFFIPVLQQSLKVLKLLEQLLLQLKEYSDQLKSKMQFATNGFSQFGEILNLGFSKIKQKISSWFS